MKKKALSSLGRFGRAITARRRRMTISPNELHDAVGCKLAQLLKDDESGWYNAACWIDEMASEKGINLAADFETPESFSRSVIEGLRFTDLEQRFPNGVDDLEPFEV